MSLDQISKENILDQIEKLHDIDLPENLVEKEIALISQNLNKEEAKKNNKENEKAAKKRIKLGLILNEFAEKNDLKVNDQEITSEIQKQIQSMPGQQKQVLEFYQKNPSATENLRGSIYEEKIISLIKKKAKKIQKIISSKEADDLIKVNFEQKLSEAKNKQEESKKLKKTIKSPQNKKKIRKK